MPTQYVALREELAAKSRQLFEITSTAGPDLDMQKVLDANLVPGAKTPEDCVAFINKANKELVELEKKFAPYREAEAAVTNASEQEKLFNRPAITPIMPGQKAAAAARGADGRKTIGQLFVEDPAYKAFAEGRSRHAQIEIPTVDLQATVFSTSAGYAPQSIRSGRTEFLPLRPIAVVDYIPEIPIDQAADVYMEETTATETSAERAEAAAYVEATYAYTERTKTVRSIGESLPVTDEQVADISGMQGLLEGRLALSVRRRLDLQVLAGNGTPPNLEGLENVSGIQTQAKGADNIGDAIFKLFRAIRDDGFAEPEVVFLRALKWQDWRLAKTVDGIYINGAPSEAGPDRIWGVPVVQTNAATSTKALAGAWSAYSALRTKTGLLVELGYVNDDFTKGKKTLRAGVRVAMSHYRPKAFGQVTGL
jgi:HK97 family phage major capsid protein